jgi:hypothetical protein
MGHREGSSRLSIGAMLSALPIPDAIDGAEAAISSEAAGIIFIGASSCSLF